MRHWLIPACVLASILAAGSRQAACAADTESELKNTMQTNFDGLNEKNLEKAMSAVHGKSPNFLTTRDTTKKLFKDFNLKHRILSFHFYGTDGDYSVARVKFEATQDKGPAFRNNVVDSVQVFRKESGNWKIWTTAVLEVKFLQEPAATEAVK